MGKSNVSKEDEAFRRVFSSEDGKKILEALYRDFLDAEGCYIQDKNYSIYLNGSLGVIKYMLKKASLKLGDLITENELNINL